MKKDISNKKDIEKLVYQFYDKVKVDSVISPFFENFSNLHWDNHLQTMCKFWENVVFYTGTYSGNPMQKHFDLNEKFPLSMKDFNQWTILFNETVDELFDGENAVLIKQRAQSISTIMQIKIFK